MGFRLQLRLLLWKNLTLKKRKPFVLMFELFIPLVLFFILLGIRKKQPAYPVGSSEFTAYPLPSAGVIAIMQAFCDNGERDSNGFNNFVNSTVKSFLEKLNTVSHHHNFFQPGFTPSDMDQIPGIYRSLVEDPVAVHDSFLGASDIPTASLFKDLKELEETLIQNFSLPKQGVEMLFGSTLDMKKVYDFVFGSHQDMPAISSMDHLLLSGASFLPSFGVPFGPSLSHLEAVVQLVHKHKKSNHLLWKGMEWIFNSDGSDTPLELNASQLAQEIKNLAFSSAGIDLLCDEHGITRLLDFPTSEAEVSKFEATLCQMNQTTKKSILEELKAHLDSAKLQESLKMNEWNLSIARQRVKALADDLRKFHVFETTLREMSELASSLPQDACREPNETLFMNDTVTEKPLPGEDQSDKKKTKENPHYGLLRIWLGMQRMICGKETKSTTTPPKDGADMNMDELGMSQYQQEQMGLLVHVLYSNPKVLYAPNETDADQIIIQANKTFELLDTVTQYAKKMLNVSEEIRDFLSQNTTDHSLSVLREIQQNLHKYPFLLNMTGKSLALHEFADGSIISDKETFLHQLDLIDNAACSWISLMDGLSLNVFQGFRNEEDLLTYFKERAYFDNVTVLASVIFKMEPNGTLPNHMFYRIRQNASFTSTTTLVRNMFWFPGPRNWGYQYYQFGFVWIQDILERAMINLYAERDVIEPGSYIHQFPYPCYLQDQFLFMIEHVMPLCLAISWVYSVSMLVQSIVYEKEQRLKEVMKTMGMNNAVHWLAWFITSFVQMTITAATLTAILKYGKVLTYSNPLVIFLLLEIFVVANITFSFLVSSLYSKAKVAAACAGIIYFLTYVPYMYIAVREEAAHDHIPAWLKSIACLLSTTAFGLGAKYFAFYEEVGVGVQWSNIGVSPVEDDEFSLQGVAFMMAMDTFLYSLLVWYIENVHPGAYGLPKPWYFPLTRSYWMGTSHQRPDGDSPSFFSRLWQIITKHKGLSVIEDDQACAMANRTDDCRFFEPDPVHLPLGVCVENLVKVYKSGNKRAVNKLSINLFEGQITSFLGHNGAGKTTTMSILTGLFPPTSGYAIIYGHDIRTEMDIIRQSMGMCPQHNVLFDELTVEEHLRFYARMKGLTKSSIDLEVEKMIEDLNLPHKRNCKVNYLSGGMKRKLSVAIAFVAGSQVVILDEPTAGVDPYSRRAIWDLILKYKRGRTILLSTHHMDEADILGDRIAIISHGQLRCCGSSLFLKNNLGEGYHLYMVKQPLISLKDNIRECQQEEVTRFICQHVSSAFLMSESKHELHYILPLSELRKGSFEKLFTALESSLPSLGISSYGIKNTTLEEVFLQVADATYRENSSLDGQRSVSPSPSKSFSLRSPLKLQNLSNSRNLLGTRSDPQERQKLLKSPVSPDEHILEGEKELRNMASTREDLDHEADDDRPHVSCSANETPRYSPLTQDTCILSDQSTWEGAGTYRVEGNYLFFQQFMAILFKRFSCTRRNWKGLFSQILLPAFFVSIAMSVALTAPKIEDLPPMILSPSQYYNYTQPEGNVIGYATNLSDLQNNGESWTQDANSCQLIQTLHLPSGVGATCVLKSSYVNQGTEQLDFSVRDFELLSAYFEPMCQSVFVHGIRLDNFVPMAPTVSPFITRDQNATMQPFTEMRNSQERYYPYCQCSDDKTGYVCQAYGYLSPPFMRVVTGDVLLNITGQYEHDYYLYTTDMFRLRRYGAFSFGLVRDHVPADFGKDAPALFRKVAVRNVAKVWFNNKGFHSMPTYINSLNNAILRANLPKSKGNPAAFGITVINHPMTDTSYMLSRDQILQGTDVLIAIFIIVAMSFVPASFVLFLVYERYTRAKHLQFVSGVNAVCYWVSNYFWDMCSYVVPATCCVLILLIFDIPAYASHKNLPAVVSLFLMYGWSITPVMYPVSFLFKEPSTAYIFLIVINLFVGITCVVTSFLLEVFSENAYLGQVHKILKTTFLMFPNYCLGRGLMDIAFNEYQNFFLFKTGQYEKMQSPFAWTLVSRKLLAMALSGLAFFGITLLCEYRFFRKPKNSKVPDYPVPPEDEDVAAERWRVLTGRADTDVLKIVNLTKVYQTRKLGKQLAVNKICLGVPEGECLGLLGVNGAGKSTTFKMLTGDMDITSGDAYLNGYSVQNELHNVQQYIGYCPQFDALYDEMTAREHLQLYSRFRGIPRKEEKKVVEWALRKLDLLPYADRLSGTYSGGNKRKLSTAIALLGAPPVIYLDEPTTGMDPYTRRFLWDLILDLVRGGRAVVLTSHSMEECEALCTRLAIMVNGTFKCMGSIQHLKNRFGEGYYITLKSKENDLHSVQKWFRRTFPDATLKEKHYNMLQYELKSGTISLAYVFSKMESALHDLPIEEYSVCQNTLDNVFINFVKQQSELGGSDSSLTLPQQGQGQGQKVEEHSLRQRQSRFGSGQEENLEETSDDDLAVQITRSQSRLAFLHLDVDC